MEEKRSRKELVKRYAVLTVGLYLMSFLFFHELRGVGVGTLLLAVCTGFVVKFFKDKLGNAVDRFLEK